MHDCNQYTYLPEQLCLHEIWNEIDVDTLFEQMMLQKIVYQLALFDRFDKPYVVVTFLSVLEMAKAREINIKQDNNFTDIYLERVD